jgi:hypothetical protein
MTNPTISVRLEARALASGFGSYSSSVAACITRATVLSLIDAVLLKTRDTVEGATPARLATS